MPHDLDQTLSLLSHTPATLSALLRDLPSAWTDHNEGGETWNATQVLEHLIHCEHVNWPPRAKQILDSGAAYPFAPFERLAPKSNKPLNELLDDFAAIRAANLDALHALHLTAVQLDLRGQHPTFGEVTLSQLLAAWSVHDLTHLTQINRILAHQYRETVGPWQQFLGVLHRNKN